VGEVEADDDQPDAEEPAKEKQEKEAPVSDQGKGPESDGADEAGAENAEDDVVVDDDDDDQKCCICNDGQSTDINPIVACDDCDLWVHQNCYFIRKIPRGSWRCDRCMQGEKDAKCVLCPNRDGAMKQCARDGGRYSAQWVHVACALWAPPVVQFDQSKAVIGVNKIERKLWNTKCAICRRGEGLCITCDGQGCKNHFHATCGLSSAAQHSGYSMLMQPNSSKALCPEHSAE